MVDGRGMGDDRLSPMRAPDFYGLRPGMVVSHARSLRVPAASR